MPLQTRAPQSSRRQAAISPGKRRREDLRRIEQAITRIGQIGGGKDAAKVREKRSGITVSRPGIAIMAVLARNGELRVGEIARYSHLEDSAGESRTQSIGRRRLCDSVNRTRTMEELHA